MTKTTTATQTTMVSTTAQEFIAFVMDKNTGMTVARVEAELDALGVVYRKKDKKEVKAQLWFEALEFEAATQRSEETVPCNRCYAEVNEVKWGLCAPCLEEVETQEEAERKAAAGETPVAVNTNPEEETEMSKVTAEQKAQNLNVLAKKYRRGEVDYNRQAEVYENPAWHAVLDKVQRAFEQYLLNIGEFKVFIERISFYPTEEELKSMPKAQGRAMRSARQYVRTNDFGSKFIGEVAVRMPQQYSVVAQWDKMAPNNKGGLGARVFTPFERFDFDFARNSWNIFQQPPAGTGLLILSIREDKAGLPYVSLPVSPFKDKASGQTRFNEVFRTADSRFIKTKDAVEKDENLYLVDNNYAFNAQVTAFIRMYTNEHFVANPENRHGFKERCGNMVTLGSRDGVMDDVTEESLKSRVLLDQVDVTQLAQAGEAQPNTFCLVTKQMLDKEAAITINDARQFEPTDYTDEEGRIRYQAHNEIMVGGKPKKVQEVREEAISKICSECPFFCNNAPKDESRVAKERTEQREKGVKNPFVNAFYKERPRAERQPVQTLVEKDGMKVWETKAPGELMGQVSAIHDMRIKGAGMSVYGAPNVLGKLDVNFKPALEVFDARHADIMKKINWLRNGAWNLRKLTDQQVKEIFILADNKPADMTTYEEEKWDAAIAMIARALMWMQEAEEAAARPDFTQCFFPGAMAPQEGWVELHVQDVMAEAMRRNEEGTFQYGLGYDDMQPKEMVRYLDELAMDYVYDVILEGKQFNIVGGTAKEKELAAGALQAMLQSELTENFYAFATGEYREASLVTSVRRAEDPAQALDDLKVSDAVKAYIAIVIGL